MKKINKLQINPEKLMKNEELKALRGGGMFLLALLILMDIVGSILELFQVIVLQL